MVIKHMAELIECKHMFSNGTEYELFLEDQCDVCTRFRNSRCRIYNAIEKARWDEKFFPYSDLMEYERYGGKVCKQFTTEKPVIKRHRKQITGQTRMTLE